MENQCSTYGIVNEEEYISNESNAQAAAFLTSFYRHRRNIAYQFTINMKKRIFFLLLCFGVLFCTSCSKQGAIMDTKESYALSTICSQSIPQTKNSKDVLEESEHILKQIEQTMSRFQEGSFVYQINHSHGQPVQVDASTYAVIEQGLVLSQSTNGAFNISIGSLTDLWNITGDNPRVPSPDEIEEALEHIDYSQVVLDPETRQITVPDGMMLDLGGIAKGYATDQIIAHYKSRGINSAILNLGGNVYVLGKKDDSSLYTVGIKDPVDGSVFGTIQAENKAVVTSGGYERYFEQDGVRYHHILDGKTGYPAQSDLLSVTVVCDSSTTADALSTALFVMGSEAGLAFAQTMEGVDVLMIDQHSNVITTPDFIEKYNFKRS